MVLVAQHEIPIRRTVTRLLGYADPGVEDLVQDVFFAAWRGRRRLRHGSALPAWLQSIAIRRCRSHVTRRARRRRLARFLPLSSLDGHSRAVEAAAAQGPDPDLMRALDGLTHEHREVLVLRHLEGLAAAEVALALGIQPGTVDVRVHRAREALRRELARLEAESDRPVAEAGPLPQDTREALG